MPQSTTGRLDGTRVLLFGGTGVIGTATSLRLAREGARVAVGALHQETADAVAKDISDLGGEAIAISVDIGDDSAVARAVDAAVRAFGGLDAVHINAAAASLELMTADSDAASLDLDVFDQVIHTNLRGPLLCTRHSIPHLLAGGGGALVYSSSASAYVGEPTRPSYATAKSGMHAIIRHVASRWGREGIRANGVAPGPILSEATTRAMDPAFVEQLMAAVRSPRLGRPEDVAGLVAFLVSSEGEWINGQIVSIDGGMTLR